MNKKFDAYQKDSELDYWRDIPLNGDLVAGEVCLQPVSERGPGSLISATFLRWVLSGQAEIVPGGSVAETSLRLIGDGSFADPLESRLWGIVVAAAGPDLVLGRAELRDWSQAHPRKILSWFRAVLKAGRSRVPKTEMPLETTRLLAFRHFLQDFTLVAEREAVEVVLWREYLVFASLLGVADTVAEQFDRLHPGIVAELVSGGDLASFNYFASIGSGSDSGLSLYRKSTETSWSDGGGGSSSDSGGGGFSGGGSGGGFR